MLIVCALGIERLALRAGRDRTGAGPPVTVVRTGMGARRAERTVREALADPRLRPAAVVAAGFCAGLAPGMRPGDVVVADETRHASGATPCTGVAPMAEAVRRALPGARIHTGPLTGSDHIVRGPERALLRATGAIGADMESAATLLTAVTLTAVTGGARPVAAVRVVVDAPEHELIRIGTVRGGLSAVRVLRAVVPAFQEWHRSSQLPRR
ncbi:1-hydroxy-2-methyl-2-butenyl 4-diphosphate reductase [Streptomyces sp. NPDC057638]|uniref:phosphorylase family protein n=1 Tax=Streptomyces sp. NPDC057638 TaxID=3346190 RepID=UPI0036A06A16